MNDLDPVLVTKLRNLFRHICERWNQKPVYLDYEKRFDSFIKNRVQYNSQYILEYQLAAQLIDKFIAERGEDGAYEYFLTAPEGLATDPVSDFQKARKLVSLEFIKLFLSLGGFQELTGAINYPGYIAGMNGHSTPYRKASF